MAHVADEGLLVYPVSLATYLREMADAIATGKCRDTTLKVSRTNDYEGKVCYLVEAVYTVDLPRSPQARTQ
jgi:hypothetical protein